MPIDFANAQSTIAKTIPVIDVSSAISGDGINGVADEIYAAAINHGFFYISNHGIEPALMEQAFAVSKAFFELSESKKQAVAVDKNQRGWLVQELSRLQESTTNIKSSCRSASIIAISCSSTLLNILSHFSAIYIYFKVFLLR